MPTTATAFYLVSCNNRYSKKNINQLFCLLEGDGEQSNIGNIGYLVMFIRTSWITVKKKSFCEICEFSTSFI